MGRFVAMNLSDAVVSTAKVTDENLVEMEIWSNADGLNLRITGKLFQTIHDDICKELNCPTYGELEEAASNLRDKLIDLKDKYEELKEAYEELKRR